LLPSESSDLSAPKRESILSILALKASKTVMVDRVVYGAVRDGRGGVCSLRRVSRAWSVGRPLRRRTTVSGLSERAEDGRAHVGAPRAAATWRTAPPAESTAETSQNPGPRGAPQACPSVPPRPRSFGREIRESARPLSSAARALPFAPVSATTTIPSPIAACLYGAKRLAALHGGINTGRPHIERAGKQQQVQKERRSRREEQSAAAAQRTLCLIRYRWRRGHEASRINLQAPSSVIGSARC
jgi:hypothetical protein